VRKALAVLSCLALAACGFQLRGTASLPFETIYVPNATAGIALDLKRNLRTGTSTRVLEEPAGAEAQLQFTEETRRKDILSLSSAGRVSEYRLIYRVGFRVADGKGVEFLPLNVVTLTRDMTYDDAQVLAKEAEEQLLFRDMQSDMVQQIMRRISTAHKPKT
jgi:LPS-assembly lipoprotein